jgi:hypothetical protein
MSTTFARKMILGAAAAIAVATLTSGCGSSTAKNQSPGGAPSSPSHSKSAPKGGGAAF